MIDFLCLMSCLYGPIDLRELWLFPLYKASVKESLETYRDYIWFFQIQEPNNAEKITMCVLRD